MMHAALLSQAGAKTLPNARTWCLAVQPADPSIRHVAAAHLLDLIRNFTVFQQVDGRTVKLAAHYQQFRGIHKAVTRLLEGRTRAQGAALDERGGIVWHTQGSGKSLSMVFLERKMRMMEHLERFKVIAVNRCSQSATKTDGLSRLLRPRLARWPALILAISSLIAKGLVG
jgi:hypothetical protein